MDTAALRVTYEALEKDSDSLARLGQIKTPHGLIETPQFMPVGSVGNIKGVLPRDLKEMGAQIILGNTYHLWLRPGLETLKEHGGLRSWMNWDGPLLTDSGGFQVFSLAKMRKISEEGAEFRSHIDGQKLMLSPEKAIEIQETIASTIMMVLDVCPALPATDKELKDAVDISTRWAKRCLVSRKPDSGALFAIAQGGLNVEMRKAHIKELNAVREEDSEGKLHQFDGIALGGFSVGEPMEEMYKVLPDIVPHMPEDKPRYLMGVGSPTDLLMAVSSGLDMFDCVMPTRNARNAYLFTSQGVVRAMNSKWRRSTQPLDPECPCYCCQNYSMSYLRHLFVAGHLTACVLASIHNLYFYQNLMRQCRSMIRERSFEKFRKDRLSLWSTSC